MEGKKTGGRQKIPMSKIENKDDRFATFSKRRSGLYKKASELVTMCDVDIGIILFSPTGKPFSFFHPTAEAVINRFLSPNLQLGENAHLVAANARNKVNQLNKMSEELESIEKAASVRTLQLDKMKENGQRSRWKSIEQLNADEVINFETWLNTTILNLNCRLKQLENEPSSS
ncbi:hypothetical protein RND71_020475 [Anisodus tanguticus]|uniref:MADS-box domain-containing protein n=1 Tax=Anisodus tanguticus TaxID=243964 RepID=A0AAE1V9F3_9SOLA|nr:hypothetical protein RND71_020475 [Anisodus tanguticus]